MQHTYRSRTFLIEVDYREDDRWHAFAMLDLGYETIQIAGFPHSKKAEAIRNALIAVRDHIRYLET